LRWTRLRRAVHRQLTSWRDSDLALGPQQQRDQSCIDCNEKDKNGQGQNLLLPTHGPEHNHTAALDSGLLRCPPSDGPFPVYPSGYLSMYVSIWSF
jgi:hypothetical protein